MGLRALAALGAAAAAEAAGLEERGGARLHVAERGFGEIDQPVMFELARGDQDQPSRRIMVGEPGMEIVDRDRRDAALAAQHGTPHRLIREGGLLQMIEDEVAADVARLPELLDHDLLLELQMLRLEMRAADQIGDQADAERQIGR